MNSVLYGFRGAAAPHTIANWRRWAEQHPNTCSVARWPAVETEPVAGQPSLAVEGERGELVERTGPPVWLAAPERGVLEVEGAHVVGRAGEVIAPDGCLLVDDPIDGPIAVADLDRSEDEAMQRARAAAKRSKAIGRGPLPPERRHAGTLGVLASRSGRKYYHWLIDVLPRLAWFEEGGTRARSWYVHRSPIHERTLGLLGIQAEDCVHAARSRHVLPDRVLRPTESAGVPTYDVCRFLWERLMPPALEAARPQRALPRRIYISRRGAHWRKVVNEAEVVAHLATQGFEEVRLEELPFPDQVRMFHDAEYIIGPHGAGLTNLAFSRPGTRVLELSTPCRPNDCFYRIAPVRELHYLNLIGLQDGPAVHFGEDSNLRVELRHLRAAMEELDRRTTIERAASRE